MGIPECVHPLSKAWIQPRNIEIEIDDTHALMSEKSFKELYEYSISIPTGVYAGKMWKAHVGNKWYLRWYEDDQVNSGMCLTRSRIILMIK